MQGDNYRKRAQDVRRAARANLHALRQQRLAKRAAISEAVVTSPAGRTHGAPAPAVAPHNRAAPFVPDDAGQSAEQEGFDQLDALAMRNAGMTKQADIAEVRAETENVNAPSEGTTPVDPPDETEQADGGDPDWKDTDLSQLPGAGPGLIWLLAECKVYSLEDLAEQDVAELTALLGVVGQILDVGKWIAFAKERL